MKTKSRKLCLVCIHDVYELRKLVEYISCVQFINIFTVIRRLLFVVDLMVCFDENYKGKSIP